MKEFKFYNFTSIDGLMNSFNFYYYDYSNVENVYKSYLYNNHNVVLREFTVFEHLNTNPNMSQFSFFQFNEHLDKIYFVNSVSNNNDLVYKFHNFSNITYNFKFYNMDSKLVNFKFFYIGQGIDYKNKNFKFSFINYEKYKK